MHLPVLVRALLNSGTDEVHRKFPGIATDRPTPHGAPALSLSSGQTTALVVDKCCTHGAGPSVGGRSLVIPKSVVGQRCYSYRNMIRQK
jgi:hypothetical protein